MDWKRELVIAHLVKQKIAQFDSKRIWKNTLPSVAASEASLSNLERSLGFDLDAQHRAFLLHANGWLAFKHYVDVFGVDDFLTGPRATRSSELIETLEPLESICGLSKWDLLPIAVSSNDIDVMAITRPHTKSPGRVLWFAGGLIETYAGFDEWFLAMVDYLREDYQRLVKNNEG